MKALSVRQPWAWAILNGKPVENRDWPEHYGPRVWLERELKRLGRIRVLLHAAKGCTKAEFGDACEFMFVACGVDSVPELSELPRGAIVGAIDIVAVVESHPSPYFVGPIGLVLENVKASPVVVPCVGSLGFFDVPADVAEQLRRAA